MRFILMVKYISSYFPSKYYRISRYQDSTLRFALYILRFWALPSLFLIYFSYINVSDYEVVIKFLYLILYYLYYFLIYDYFCARNDKLAGIEKIGGTSRTGIKIPAGSQILYCLVGIPILYIVNIELKIQILVMISYFITVFSIHNAIQGPLRTLTYFFLYFGKLTILLSPFAVDLTALWTYTAIYSLAYLPNYFYKKIGWNMNLWIIAVTRGYVMKTLLFLCIGLTYDANFIFFAIINLVVTGLEYLILKLWKI